MKPSQRTRSRKRVCKALPGGGKTVHFKREVCSPPICHLCGGQIGGIPRVPSSKKRRQNLTKRTVYRPYGGQLCHKCLRKLLKQAARTRKTE